MSLENHYYEGKIEAGCDEAGRGCLAGSVYAAAVILPDGYDNPSLNDSKRLSAAKRKRLRDEIVRDAQAWAVGVVTPEEIDHINILRASILAMHRALERLRVMPEAIIVDGYQAIAAASILAKTFRDEYMERLAEEFPQYGWQSNKGYPTPQHREAIRQYGVTPYHRKSFDLLGSQELFLDFADDETR